MQRKAFNAHIRDLTNPKTRLLDPRRVDALPVETRLEIVQYIVRARKPVDKCLLVPGDENTLSWLHCCGYLYTFQGEFEGTPFTLLCDIAQYVHYGGKI